MPRLSTKEKIAALKAILEKYVNDLKQGKENQVSFNVLEDELFTFKLDIQYPEFENTQFHIKLTHLRDQIAQCTELTHLFALRDEVNNFSYSLSSLTLDYFTNNALATELTEEFVSSFYEFQENDHKINETVAELHSLINIQKIKINQQRINQLSQLNRDQIAEVVGDFFKRLTERIAKKNYLPYDEKNCAYEYLQAVKKRLIELQPTSESRLYQKLVDLEIEMKNCKTLSDVNNIKNRVNLFYSYTTRLSFENAMTLEIDHDQDFIADFFDYIENETNIKVYIFSIHSELTKLEISLKDQETQMKIGVLKDLLTDLNDDLRSRSLTIEELKNIHVFLIHLLYFLETYALEEENATYLSPPALNHLQEKFKDQDEESIADEVIFAALKNLPAESFEPYVENRSKKESNRHTYFLKLLWAKRGEATTTRFIYQTLRWPNESVEKGNKEAELMLKNIKMLREKFADENDKQKARQFAI